jgi:hypothetical protein
VRRLFFSAGLVEEEAQAGASSRGTIMGTITAFPKKCRPVSQNRFLHGLRCDDHVLGHELLDLTLGFATILASLHLFCFRRLPRVCRFIYCNGLALLHVNSIYALGRGSPTKSCFFMPRAPQPLSDSDQALALLAGLVAFLGAEVAPRILKKLREAWRSRRLFEQEVERRVGTEMARRTNSGLTPGQGAVPAVATGSH